MLQARRTAGVSAVLAAVVTCLCLYLCASAPAAGDANHAECATELAGFPGVTSEATPGFRSFMPDCRAYELVTPPYIGGDVPEGKSNISSRQPEISADGEHLLGIVFGGFAGTENEEQAGLEYGAVYEFSRTPTGWAAESLEPPASQYVRRNFVFPSADLSKSLWELFTPAHGGEELPLSVANDATLAIRERAGDGTVRFATVGPVVAPEHEPEPEGAYSFAVVGASAELTNVLLQVTAEGKQLWPGDETSAYGKSLYEYRGTGEGEPVLVGVKNEGAAPWRSGAAHVNEGAELESDCGTILGSVEVATAYNAVSANGGVVYFTALECPGGPPVNELYARVDGSATVKISGTGAAVFRGASKDGSRVFFTEGENLYEATITEEGSKSHVMSVTSIASEVTTVTAPAEDGKRVYFQSTAELPTGPNGNGEGPKLGANNLYLYEAASEAGPARTVYVAQDPGPVDATREGQYAVFKSAEGEATEGEESEGNKGYAVEQLFEYNADTRGVVRVSVGQSSPAGYECSATKIVEERFDCDGITTSAEDAPVMSAPASYSAAFPAEATSKLSVSAGGTVVFMSRDALAPYAVAGGENIYEYQAGDVYLISPGDEAVAVQGSSEEIRLEGIDESGQDVFFRSQDSLVPQDVDTQESFYDARAGGGFPAPASSAACSGEACQGPLPATPVFAAPASNSVAVSGNLAPPVELKPAVKPATKPKAKRCKKGFVKKKAKCVKAPKAKKAKKASRDRRAGR